LVVVRFYRFVGRLNWVTACFAGMPGGLREMIEIGVTSGAKPAPIILAHSLRIVVTIALIAFGFCGVPDQNAATQISPSVFPLSLIDAILLLASAVLGSLPGR